MLTTVISLIMLITISKANKSSTVKCKGEHTVLSCLESSKHTEDKEKINALWKKSSGEKVIWSYYGESKPGDSFTNRAVKLNDDLSLSIEECHQYDQGTYILCIDGKPSCRVRLFVDVSEGCNKTKTGSEQSTRSPTTLEKSMQDVTENQQKCLPRHYTIFFILFFLFLLILFAVFAANQISKVHTREKSKNHKSESKLLNNDAQNNIVKACV